MIDQNSPSNQLPKESDSVFFELEQWIAGLPSCFRAYLPISVCES